MLGHDHAPRAIVRGVAESADDGPTRYLFLNAVAIPALRAGGVNDATIDLMTREVPRRFLTGTGV